MKAPALTAVVILIFFAGSCKKDASFPLEPSTVYKKKGKTKITTRLFALQGEIKTAAIIDRYKGVYDDWINSLSEYLYPFEGYVDNFRVKSADVIEVSNNLQYAPYRVNQQGNRITLTSDDTAHVFSYGEVFTRTVHYNIVLYKPLVFGENLVSSTRGVYGFEYYTFNQYHLQAEGEGIIAPWIVGVAQYADGSTASIRLQNKIDAGFHKRLAAGDTVVVQEYVVHYEK